MTSHEWGFEEDANYFEASPPADPRRQSPLYVEARCHLQPAVDFYARAVQSADALGSTTGDLLAAVSALKLPKELITDISTGS
jgi:hypothetical protein